MGGAGGVAGVGGTFDVVFDAAFAVGLVTLVDLLTGCTGAFFLGAVGLPMLTEFRINWLLKT